jgi:hypothetical protein
MVCRHLKCDASVGDVHGVAVTTDGANRAAVLDATLRIAEELHGARAHEPTTTHCLGTSPQH